MSASYRLSILLMAAGASRRFEGIKQLALVGERPMLQCSIDTVLAVPAHQRYVVFGANAKTILSNLDISGDIECGICPHWHLGLGNSIADATHFVSPQSTHILVMLADQVALQSRDIMSLVEASMKTPEQIVASGYMEVSGVPAIFPRRYLEQLKHLSGDHGARELIRNNSIISVPMPNAVLDIDTQESLQQWQQFNEEQESV